MVLPGRTRYYPVISGINYTDTIGYLLIDRPTLLCKMGLGVGPKGPESKKQKKGNTGSLYVILVRKPHGVVVCGLIND